MTVKEIKLTENLIELSGPADAVRDRVEFLKEQGWQEGASTYAGCSLVVVMERVPVMA
jgi:hypothetical protein